MTYLILNSSKFNYLVAQVDTLIQEHLRVGAGQIERTAPLIAAQLANVHHLAPAKLAGMPDWTVDDDGHSEEFQKVADTIGIALHHYASLLFADTQYVARQIMKILVEDYHLVY